MMSILVFLGGVYIAGKLALKSYRLNEDPNRFEKEIVKIENRYKDGKPSNVVVFLGSSSIRFWKTLEDDMGAIPVVNHGFGGAKVQDATFYVDRLVAPFSPRAVVIFIGSNDHNGIKGSTKPADIVAASTIRLFKTIHASQPGIPLIYLSITPTKSRWQVWDEAVKTNHIIKTYTESEPKITYIEVSDAFLKDGVPNTDLFKVDRLHLNSEGYAIWTQALKPVLDEALNDGGT